MSRQRSKDSLTGRPGAGGSGVRAPRAPSGIFVVASILLGGPLLPGATSLIAQEQGAPTDTADAASDSLVVGAARDTLLADAYHDPHV